MRERYHPSDSAPRPPFFDGWFFLGFFGALLATEFWKALQ